MSGCNIVSRRRPPRNHAHQGVLQKQESEALAGKIGLTTGRRKEAARGPCDPRAGNHVGLSGASGGQLLGPPDFRPGMTELNTGGWDRPPAGGVKTGVSFSFTCPSGVTTVRAVRSTPPRTSWSIRVWYVTLSAFGDEARAELGFAGDQEARPPAPPRMGAPPLAATGLAMSRSCRRIAVGELAGSPTGSGFCRAAGGATRAASVRRPSSRRTLSVLPTRKSTTSRRMLSFAVPWWRTTSTVALSPSGRPHTLSMVTRYSPGNARAAT